MSTYLLRLHIPQTEFSEVVKENGWKVSTDWSRFDNITPVFENPSLPAKTMMETRRKVFNQFYSPSNILRQSLKRTYYNRSIARTALNYQLMRIRLPMLISASLKKSMPQQSALNRKQTGAIKTEKLQFKRKKVN